MDTQELRVTRLLTVIGVLLLFVFVPATQAGAESNEGKKAQAKKHFDKAQVYYRQANFRKALEEYRKANELRTHHALVFNMAQCHRQLGEHKKALFMYRLFLTEKPDAPNKQEIQQWISQLKLKIAEQERAEKHRGKVSVVSKPEGAEILVNQFKGTPVAITPSVLQLKEGNHLIVVRKRGHKTVNKNVKVKAGELISVDFTLTPVTIQPVGDKPRDDHGEDKGLDTSGQVKDASTKGSKEDGGKATRVSDEVVVGPEASKPFYKRWWFWTGAVGAVALGIGGTVTGVMTLQTQKEWEESGEESDRDRGKTLRTVTDVFLGAAILTAAGVTVGALLVHYGGKKGDERQAVITPGCDANGCGIFATGRF